MLEILTHHNLLPYNTFGLHANAARFCELTDVNQLIDIYSRSDFEPTNTLWLGGGSNVLFMEDYDGLVVHMANKGVQKVGRKQGKVLLEAQAGEIWHDFVIKTISMGLSGLENLSLIPGTVGASPVQNIGAYGVEVKDFIEHVRCFDLQTHEFIELSNKDCLFNYRDSIFKHGGKGRYVIVSVTFVLNTQFEPVIQYGDLAKVIAEQCGEREPNAKDVSNAVCKIRQSKLPNPAELGNVGSFYKNPIISAEKFRELHTKFPNIPHYPQKDGNVKIAAGWLIDQCGLKGKQIGGAAVHDKQALVLINKNKAIASDVRGLSNFICADVWVKFGVSLVAEPLWLPE